MNIDSIKNGIVIDHIAAGLGMKLYFLLGLDSLDCSVAIIKNAPSSKMGKKDIIKIDSCTSVNFDVIGMLTRTLRSTSLRTASLQRKKQLQCLKLLPM